MFAVTGATGHLGKLVISELLNRGVKAQNIVAVVRDRNKVQDFLAKGLNVREGNYSNSESLEKAFAGVDKLLLISGSEVGQRVQQHTNVVNAAKKAGVKFIAYTSILKADSSKMLLAKEHLATENFIKSSGIPYSFLRNSWYIENYTGQLENVLKSGVIAGSAQSGKISAATRADYAAAAVAVLLANDKANTAFELGGEAFTLSELAAVVSRVSGKKIEYKDMPTGDYAKLLIGFGVPQVMAEVLADSDAGIVRGDLYTERDDLKMLLGRSPTSLEAAVRRAVEELS